MKKFFSIFLAVALCVSVAVPLTLSAANSTSDPIKAHLFVTGVQSGKKLSEVPGLYDSTWCDECTSVFTGVNSMVDYTNEPAIEFNNSAVIDNYSWENQCTFLMNNKTPNGKYFLFYVKTPAGAPHEVFFIAKSGDVRQSIKAGEKYQLLDVNSTAWKEQTVKAWASDDDDGLLDLPAGFEGYVRIPVNTLYAATADKAKDLIKADSPISILGLRFSNYGGNMGPVYVGPIMVQENDTDSTAISLNNGTAVSLIKSEPKDPQSENPLSARLLFTTEDIKSGDNLMEKGACGAEPTTTVSMTAIDSLVSYTDQPSVRIDSSADSLDKYNTQQLFRFYIPEKTGKLTDGKAIMFYVKSPAAANHRMYIQFETTADKWVSVATGCPYSLLDIKGDGSWQDMTAPSFSGGHDGAITIPAGFEGYVKVSFETGLINHSSGTVLSTTDTLSQMRMYISNIGGSKGVIDMGPIMVVTNKSDSNKLSLNNGTAVSLIKSEPKDPQSENPLSARLLFTTEDIKSGDNLMEKGACGAEPTTTVSMTAIDSLVSYTDQPSVRVDSSADSLDKYNTKQLFRFYIPEKTGKLTDGNSIMFYVKSPAAANHRMYIQFATTADKWVSVETGCPYSLLDIKGDGSWQDMTAPSFSGGHDGAITIPAGFEGYVKVCFETGLINHSSGTVLSTTDTLSQMRMYISNIGGSKGVIDIGPIMVVTNKSDSNKLSLNGGTPVIYKPETKPSAPGLKAEIISKFDYLAIGDDVIKSKYGSATNGITLTAVNSQVGYTNYPAVSVDNKDIVAIDSTGLDATETYFYTHIYQKLNDASDIMFYAKMPNKANKMFLVVETNTDGSTEPTSWPRIEKNAKYSLLRKGSTTWTNKTATALDQNGLLEFEAGFEGYVKIPLSSITWESQGVVVDSNYSITRLLFRCSNFGGATGPILVGPFMKVTQDADSNTAYIDGAKEKVDLFAAPTYDETKPLLNFQVISDTHVDDYGGGAISIGARQMINALKDIKDKHSDTNAIVHCGDITENASIAQYRQAYGYFDSYSPTSNILVTMGNHDIRGNFNGSDAAVSYQDMVARFTNFNKKYSGTEKPYFDKWINGYHFIVLCTDEKLKDQQKLGDEQIEWFAEKVREGASSTKPIFVISHSPIEGTFNGKAYNCIDPSDQIRDIMNKYPQIVLISGHLHTIDTDAMIISKGHGIFVDVPSLHNDNRPQDPTDQYHKMYYNISVYSNRLDINLYDYALGKNVNTFSINTSDFGKVSEDEPKPEKDPVMKAKNFPFLAGLKAGDTVKDPGVATTHYSANEINKATVTVAESINGLTNVPSLKIDSDNHIVRHGIGDQTQFDLGLEGAALTPMKGGKAFVLYVKMPTGDDGTGNNEIFFNIQNGNKGGGDLRWNRFRSGTVVKYLAKGTNKWVTTTTPDTGTVKLPVGFEGYVYAPFDELVDDVNFEGLDNTRYFQHIGLSVGYFGGDYGPFYCYPMLMATNDTVSKDGVMYEGSDKISNLFTGTEMTQSEVYEDPTAPPDKGTITPSLPSVTTDKKLHDIDDNDVTDSTVKLTWDAFDNASKYRVDVYKSEFGAQGLTFVYSGNKYVNGTSCMIEDLEPSTRYYFVVNALDANGNIIGVYSDQSTNTQYLSDPSDNNDPTSSGNNNDVYDTGDYSEGYDEDFPQTGNTFPLPLILTFVLSLGFVCIACKKLS